MATKKKFPDSELPVYSIEIDDSEKTGIRFVSLVDEPAILMKGQMFSKEGINNYAFKANEDKQVIIGPALIPNLKILRQDEDGSKYYVVFTKEVIEKMVKKFNAGDNNRSINVDHSNTMVKAFIYQNWIVNDAMYGEAKSYGFNVPEGTWMVVLQIEDKKFWDSEVKDLGKFGMSVEGIMGQSPLAMSINDYIDSLTYEEAFELLDSAKKKVETDRIFEVLKKKAKSKVNLEFIDVVDFEPGDPNEAIWLYSGPRDEKNRDFCRAILDLDSYWTETDLRDLSNEVGYDVSLYMGGFYGHSPQCRHTWKLVHIKQQDLDVNGVSGRDISDVSDKQSDTMADYLG